jgi:DNA-binding transcriptional MerR regulator
MRPDKLRFTRQQIAELTGVDDSTLNYWMREGLLRPEEGGGGRGQHRRFTYLEVNLAAVLGELRKFGTNIDSLRDMARYLHDSVDWATSLGMSLDDIRHVKLIQDVRSFFDRNGYFKADAADLPDREADELSAFTGKPMVHLKTWRDVVEYLNCSSGFYRLELGCFFQERHYELAESLPNDEVSKHNDTRALFDHTPTKLPKYRDFWVFRRLAEGWEITTEYAKADIPAEVVSYISIDLITLYYRVWNT